MGVPATGTYSEPAQFQTVLEQLTTAGCELLAAPSVRTRQFQRAEISIASSFSYVKQFDVRVVQPSGSLIADPVVGVIEEGLFIRLRNLALPGGSIGLTFDVENVEVLRPVRTESVRIAAGVETTGEVSFPAVMRARLFGDVRLGDGATAFFVTPWKEDRDLALFLSVDKR
jgi:hypothetical protein